MKIDSLVLVLYIKKYYNKDMNQRFELTIYDISSFLLAILDAILDLENAQGCCEGIMQILILQNYNFLYQNQQ